VTRFTALFVCAVLVCGVARAADDEKPQDKAKAVAVAFAKAINARDVDAMMRVSNVPFYVSLKSKDTETVFFEKAEDLKADMKQRLGELRADRRLSETVEAVYTVEEMFKRVVGVVNPYDQDFKRLREVLGENGYWIVLGADPDKSHAILMVTISKDGKAKVVGGGYR
jgi:alpha-glucosidase (family GH31 glycosyl hydrolase)